MNAPPDSDHWSGSCRTNATRLARLRQPFRISFHMRFILFAAATMGLSLLCSFGQNSAPPAWAAEAIFYQIFPERFCNGDSKNDPTRDSLEIPINPPPSYSTSSWTADWYSRAEWEKEFGPDFYKNGVFD